MAQMDDVVDFFIDIGADFNKGIRRAYSRYPNIRAPRTYLDAAREICSVLESSIQELDSKEKAGDSKEQYRELATTPGWKGALGAHLLQIAEASEKTSAPAEHSNETRLVRMRRALTWYTKVAKILEENGAKTWKELYPDEVPDLPGRTVFSLYTYWYHSEKATLTFFDFSGLWQFSQVPTHNVALYEELFQACCDGDNAKIEELCLPKDGKSGKTLIQVAARYGNNVDGASFIFIPVLAITLLTGYP